MPAAAALASTLRTDTARALALADGNSRTNAVVRLGPVDKPLNGPPATHAPT